MLSLIAGAAARDAKTDYRTTVNFVHPDKFTDAKDHYMPTDSGRDAILDQLRQYLQQRGQNYVPAGDKLEVDFTDVDLAGDFEPWRGPMMDDVRIVKDIYPPRFELSFKLTGPNGEVIKEGTRKLTDLSFQWNISINVNDPLRFEKQLLDGWMRDEFPRAKKS